MKKIFTTFLIVCIVTLCKAQWVTIPDANFVAWLHDPINGVSICMNGNQMDTTCPEILITTYVDCSSENISDLTGIQYFDSLQSFSCGNNQLTSLPQLSNYLTDLECSNNQLVNLPSLPNSCTYLLCDHNQLTSLPVLSDSLGTLMCGSNLLTTLPPLPNSLTYFSCDHNLLTNLSAIPNSLTAMNCSGNYLTTIPVLPNTLTSLWCDSSQITSFTNLPDSLHLFSAVGNPLHCLPPLLKYGGVSGWFNISGTQITCLPNVIQHTGYIAAIDTLPICDVFNPNGCPVFWNIFGKVYFDSNNNCVYDSGDSTQYNLQVQLLSGGNLSQITFTNSSGNYSFDVNSFGTYEVTIDTTNSPFFVLCTNSGIHTSVISSLDSMDSNVDFALMCKPDYDVTVNSSVKDSGLIRPGNKSLINIHAGDLTNFYGADCMSGIGGQIQVTVTGPAQYDGYSAGSLAPTTVTGNTINWNIADFGAVNFFHDFHIRLLTDTTATIGDFVCIDATVTANPADANQGNNHLNQCFTVVNSFDPNVKEVSPQELTSANDWLTYTIHFQNTGTAPAQHIQILDTLDSDLDVSTFQLLAYSHPNMTQVVEGGIVKFNFPNINLPDSGSNEPASHGYIQYKIKPNSGVTPTTTFDNTASIYFDFNSPVVTNTTHTAFATGIKQLAADSWQFAVYPNPVESQLTIYSEQLAGSTITVTDILGRTIHSEQANQKSKILNLKSFASGIYFIKVQSQLGEVQVKKIVRQ